MPRYFTAYWTNDNCDYYLDQGLDGQPLDHTAGSRFNRSGGGSVGEQRDYLYVVTVRKGRLFLIGKMEVKGPAVTQEQAAASLPYEPYHAREHLMAKACTRMRFNWKVPVSISTTRALEFKVPRTNRTRRLKFRPGTNLLDPQTLRSARQLTHTSAVQLDRLLEPMQPVDWKSTVPDPPGPLETSQ